MRFKHIVLPFFALLTLSVSAQQIIPEKTARALEKKSELSNFYESLADLALIPDLPFSNEIRADLKKLNPRIGGEILFRQRLPDYLKAASPENRDLHVYNIMRKISSMQGIEYYSRSRKKMRLLFEQSYIVDKLKSTEAMPDRLVENIPEKASMMCFQKDLSFGTNYYSLDYSHAPGVSMLRYSNLDSMLYKGIIKAVSPEHMALYMMVFTDGDYLFIYGIFGADVPTLLGLDNKAEGSLYEGLKAIKNWFVASL